MDNDSRDCLVCCDDMRSHLALAAPLAGDEDGGGPEVVRARQGGARGALDAAQARARTPVHMASTVPLPPPLRVLLLNALTFSHNEKRGKKCGRHVGRTTKLAERQTRDATITASRREPPKLRGGQTRNRRKHDPRLPAGEGRNPRHFQVFNNIFLLQPGWWVL